MAGLSNIKTKFRWLSVGAVPVVLIIMALWFLSLFVVLKYSGKIAPSLSSVTKTLENQRVVDEESVVIDVVQKVSPSVVSIGVENMQTINLFGIAQKGQDAGIGTGFV